MAYCQYAQNVTQPCGNQVVTDTHTHTHTHTHTWEDYYNPICAWVNYITY